MGGTRVEVGEAAAPRTRVRVGGMGVQVIKNPVVEVLDGNTVTDAVALAVSEGVAVRIYSEISTTVIATAVLIGLEKAESTISCGSMSDAWVVPGFMRAAAEAIQKRLKPNTPAAMTVKGP